MDVKEMAEKIIIYGAKSIALGVSHAIQSLYPERTVLGFMVTSADENPRHLNGLPVMDIETCLQRYFCWKRPGSYKKDEVTILIGTPETVHSEIIGVLERYGFTNYVCIDWELEERLMDAYYARGGQFRSLHDSVDFGQRKKLQLCADGICVYRAKCHRDAKVINLDGERNWMHAVQAGASVTDIRVAEELDNEGENISEKNGNYCELTVLYWMWKNRINMEKDDSAYYGLFQSRRLLNIKDTEIQWILEKAPDAILPFPTLHEPDIREHHERYIKEEDWNAMVQALYELQPDYAKAFGKLLRQPYFYNYNMIIAKKKVLQDYCGWLFPILERTESLSKPRGCDREDRYIGYLGESLMTLYFLYHAKQLKIFHTGRIMLV